MEALLELPMIVLLVFLFLFGLGIGSFLNVLIARLPFEKSVVWPESRCFSCYQPIKLRHNLPIVGYLLLRGRCGTCGAKFSSRYLWVELGTGVAFVGLFVVEVLLNWHDIPGLADARRTIRADMLPPARAIGFFVAHATLLSLLIAAAAVDAEHRVIPPQITYPGVVLGLIASTVFAWPWPTTDPAVLEKQANLRLNQKEYDALKAVNPKRAAELPPDPWWLPEVQGQVQAGMTLAPFWGPPPKWAPPGSWKLGLLNGLIGAAVGTALVRVFKALFEFGFGQEALGMGDADLLMMAGAFLGWQAVVLAFFTGAFVAILTAVPIKILGAVRGQSFDRYLSFGPGLATGVVLVWLGWKLLVDVRAILYDPVMVGLTAVIIFGGILIAGMLLRRGKG
jgi:leader peptidase (prepilin peptidase)/N-methyltransferase